MLIFILNFAQQMDKVQNEIKKDIKAVRDEVKKDVGVVVKKEVDFYRDTPARLLGEYFLSFNCLK